MKKLFSIALLSVSFAANAQTKTDTLQLLQRTAALYDLNFTTAEADSMLEGIKENTDVFRQMHKTIPANSMSYPFAYNPAPAGFKIPSAQQKIDWAIPATVALPANRNDLAFYSVAQLSSLIKSKKITSVALTQLF